MTPAEHKTRTVSTFQLLLPPPPPANSLGSLIAESHAHRGVWRGPGRALPSARRRGAPRAARASLLLPSSLVAGERWFVRHAQTTVYQSPSPWPRALFPVWGYSRMKPLGTLLSESLQRHDFISQACVCFRRTCPMFCHVALNVAKTFQSSTDSHPRHHEALPVVLALAILLFVANESPCCGLMFAVPDANAVKHFFVSFPTTVSSLKPVARFY